MAEEKKGEGATPPLSKAEQEEFLKVWQEGVEYSIALLPVLHGQGIKVGGRAAFMGLLLAAYGVGVVGTGIDPETFGITAKVVGEMSDAIRNAATPERKAAAAEQAKDLCRRMGIDIEKVLKERVH